MTEHLAPGHECIVCRGWDRSAIGSSQDSTILCNCIDRLHCKWCGVHIKEGNKFCDRVFGNVRGSSP